MDKMIETLLKDFDNLIQALIDAKYHTIAEILKSLKKVFIKEIR